MMRSPLLSAGQGDALGQGGGHGAQLEPLEQRREFGVTRVMGSLLRPIAGGMRCKRRRSRDRRSDPAASAMAVGAWSPPPGAVHQDAVPRGSRR